MEKEVQKIGIFGGTFDPLATIDEERLVPSTVEIERSKPSYTIDTIKEFRNRFPEEKIFFITGSDSFAEITTWKDYEKLLGDCLFLVNLRAGVPFSRLNHLPQEIRERTVELTSSNPSEAERAIKEWGERKGASIFLVKTPEIPISSTEIRERITAGKRFDHLLPERVARYIERLNLYR